MSDFLKRAARSARGGRWPWEGDEVLDPSLEVDLGVELTGQLPGGVQLSELFGPPEPSPASVEVVEVSDGALVGVDLGEGLEPERGFGSRSWEVEGDPGLAPVEFEPDLGEGMGTWTVADRGPGVSEGEDRFIPVPASYEPSAFKPKGRVWNEDPRILQARLQLTGPAMSRQEAFDAAKALNGLVREVLEG